MYYDSGQWSGVWESLGGFYSSPPAVASWGIGRYDVFVIGAGGNMYHKAYGGAEGQRWDAEWYNLSGNFSSPPAVVS